MNCGLRNFKTTSSVAKKKPTEFQNSNIRSSVWNARPCVFADTSCFLAVFCFTSEIVLSSQASTQTTMQSSTLTVFDRSFSSNDKLVIVYPIREK